MEFKRKATDVNGTELKRNRRCIGDGRAHHYDDTNHQYPSKLHAALLHVREKYPSKLKELDYLDHSYRKSGDHSLRCDDENRVAETSECQIRQGTGSSRREHLTCSTEENSSNSSMGRNAQKKSMNHATEGQRSNYDLYDQNPGNNNHYRYEQQFQANYSSNDNYDSNRWGNMRSAFPPACFGAGQWQVPFHTQEDLDMVLLDGKVPHSTGYLTSRWHSLPFYRRRPEHADYTTYQNNLSSINHGGYHAMGTYPASRYSPCVNNNGAYQPHIDVSLQGHGARYGHNCDYGVRPNYAFGWGPQTPAGGSVMDRYAPRLEQTNYQPRGGTTF